MSMTTPPRRDLPRQSILAQAAISSTALAVVDQQLPRAALHGILRTYLSYFHRLTGATAVELYATDVQLDLAASTGLDARVVGYHVPWLKGTRQLEKLLAAPRTRPAYATLHFYEWLTHLLTPSSAARPPSAALAADELRTAQLDAHLLRTAPLEAELACLDRAADAGLQLIFETVVDREFYDWLAAAGCTRERYLFTRLEALLRLRDAWLLRHGASQSALTAPIAVGFNPWHAAMEMRGPALADQLTQGVPTADVRNELLLPVLSRYLAATAGLVQRFYAGNSRRWEVRLPEMLQRGRVLDAHGVVPEMPLLHACLQADPTLAQRLTLEAPPQSALLSNRWVS